MFDFIDVKTDEDIKKLSVLSKEIWEEYWINFLSRAQLDYMVEKFQSYEAMRAQIRNENYMYRMIYSEGTPVGYFGVAIKDKRVWHAEREDIGFKYLFLSKLYVKKEYRRNRIGEQAFSQIKEIAKKLGMNYIYLTVNKHNVNSIAAYTKWGFRTVEAAVIQIGQGFVMDDYIMRYEV